MAVNIEEIKLEVERLRQEAEAEADWEKRKKIIDRMEKLINKVIRQYEKDQANAKPIKGPIDWPMRHLTYILEQTIDNS